MEVKAKLKVKPFRVPNFVSLECEGMGEQVIPISSLTSEDLAAMAEEFERNLFKKAGKERPARADAPIGDK